MDLETDVVCARRATLAESPRWDEPAGLVRWLDLDEGLVCSSALDGSRFACSPVGAPVGALVLHRDGGVLLAQGLTWLRRFPDGDSCVVASARPAPGPALRFNDAGVDAAGRVWSATMRCDEHLGPPALGALHRLDGDGLTVVHQGLRAGNGIGWSPDDRWCYLVDSGSSTVLRWAFDTERGPVGAPHAWLTVNAGSAVMPDGLAVDAEGGVWIALWGAGRVDRYSPDARLIGSVRLPTPQVTSMAFAGERLDALVVCTAALGLPTGEDPLAGAVFAVRPGVPGVPLHRAAF